MFGRRLAGRTRRAFLDDRSVRRWHRSVLAAQDNDLNSAQIVKKCVVGLVDLVSRHQIQTMKRPVPAQKAAVRLLGFLLSDTQINFDLLIPDALGRNLEPAPVAVTLILAIHVNKHGKARRNVALRGEVDAEVYFFAGYGDVAGHMAVAVVFAILDDFGVRAA